MTTKINSIFKPKTTVERAKTLADYLPNGELFRSKNEQGSSLYNLLLGLAVEIGRSEDKMNEIAREQDPRYTQLLIEQWEQALGIPDSCFPGNGTLEERREHIVIKLGLAVSTKESFEALAAEFGYTVIVEGGARYGAFPMEFPIIFFPSGKDARFTLIVDLDADLNPSLFDLTFPFTFGPKQSNIIECLFKKLKPANVDLLFRYIL